MDEIINKNDLFIVKEYKFDKKDIHEKDYILDDVIKDCRNYLHTFDYKLVYDINFINISINEEINLIITHKAMQYKTEYYSLNKKIKNARQNGFIFNQINYFKIEIYSNISCMNIDYRFKITTPPPLVYTFFKHLLKNRDYVRNYCFDYRNPFHIACRQWYLYKNQGILT